MRILVIEDDELLRGQLSRHLRREGFEVDAAEDGAVGMELFGRSAPDLVITDLVMPNREGLETIQGLKKLNAGVPIIAMSGGVRGSQDFLRVAKLMGAAAAFAKPFDISDLVAAVRELLGAADEA